MRYAILILLGLAIGAMGTVMAMNALHNKPDHPRSAMEMIDFHMDGLGDNLDAHRCAATDNLQHLQTLRALSNDLEPIFLPTGNDKDFREKASNLRTALDATLASPPADCAAMQVAMKNIGHACRGCHSEFRH